ncbi:hypothetical protein Tco_1288116, partial [Tanacetum coccineum]
AIFRCAVEVLDLLDLGFVVFWKLACSVTPHGGDTKKKGAMGGSSELKLDYYHECNALWRQFDALIDLPAYACVSAPKVKEHSQLLRLMQFLMGLDDVFSSVRTLILTIEPLPHVKSAFATLSRDDSHRRSSSNNRRFGRGSNVDMNGHTIDRCFELVGYPPGFKKNNGGQNSANNASIKSH